MKHKTMRLVRMLSDIRHAQRCTALRAAAAAAEADAALAQPANDAPGNDEDDERQSDDSAPTNRPRAEPLN